MRKKVHAKACDPEHDRECREKPSMFLPESKLFIHAHIIAWGYNGHMFQTEIYRQIKEEIGDGVQLCAVSKMHPEEEIQAAYALGQRMFGENKAAELVRKAEALPKDIEWHFIGHLQRNKVRTILPYVTLIQSLDSLRLAKEIEKEAAKLNKTADCLLEVHLAEADTNKTGLAPEEAASLLAECQNLPHVHIIGMMAMGPHTEDEAEITRVFKRGQSLFSELKNQYPDLCILSMGMSDDYPLAIAAGANMIRIGSILFNGE